MHPEPGNVFPHHRGLAIPTCIAARAWRTCRDACRDRYLAVSVEVGGGENVPGIPGACATRNFTYLVRASWHLKSSRTTLFVGNLFTLITKKNIKCKCYWSCVRESISGRGFHTQRTSNAEYLSVSWRNHGVLYSVPFTLLGNFSKSRNLL